MIWLKANYLSFCSEIKKPKINTIGQQIYQMGKTTTKMNIFPDSLFLLVMLTYTCSRQYFKGRANCPCAFWKYTGLAGVRQYLRGRLQWEAMQDATLWQTITKHSWGLVWTGEPGTRAQTTYIWAGRTVSSGKFTAFQNSWFYSYLR